MRAVRRGASAGGAPLAAAKGRRHPELHWPRAEKPRGKLDGAVHPVPRRGARRAIMSLSLVHFWKSVFIHFFCYTKNNKKNNIKIK